MVKTKLQLKEFFRTCYSSIHKQNQQKMESKRREERRKDLEVIILLAVETSRDNKK